MSEPSVTGPARRGFGVGWSTRLRPSRSTLKLFGWLAVNFLFSLAVAVVLALETRDIVSRYYQWFPFVGDTFSYFSRRLREAMTIAEYGRRAVLTLAQENQRNPLTTLSVAFYPAVMAPMVSSFVFFNAACYAAFSFMLSHVVWRRTGLWAFALAAAVMAAGLAVFFDPIYGFASELPDLPAAFLAGAAILALVASERGDKPLWIIGFAILAGLATLSRISASMYVFAVCAPLVAIYFVRILLVQGVRRLLLVALVSAVALYLVAGKFLYEQFLPTLEFYRIAGYGLNSDLETSFRTTVAPFFNRVLGGEYWALLVPALVWVAQARRRDIDWWSLAETVWLVLSIPLLLTLVLKQRDDVTQMYFGIPGMALLATAPFALKPEARWRFWPRPALAVLLPCLALAAYAGLAAANYQEVRAKHPNFTEHAQRAYHHQMAEIFVSAQTWAATQQNEDHFVFDAAYDYYWRFIVPAAQFDFHARLDWRPRFQIRESQWQLVYGTVPLDQQRKSFFNDMELNLGGMAVLSDPEAAEALESLKDQGTVDWAVAVRDYLRGADRSWMKFAEAEGPVGNTEIYLNTAKPEYDRVRNETALVLRDALRKIVGDRGAEGEVLVMRAAMDLATPATPSAILPEGAVSKEVDSLIPLIGALSSRYSVEDAAQYVYEIMRSGVAVVALPVDAHAPSLSIYMLNDVNVSVVDGLRAKLKAAPETWETGGTVATEAGAFELFVNKNLFVSDVPITPLQWGSRGVAH